MHQKKCDWLHIRKTRKPLEHQQDVATAPSRQENTNLSNPQQHSNSNHVGQSYGVQQPRVHDGHFQNRAPGHSDQGSRPSCDGGRPFCESRESSAVAVHGHHHCSVDQSQRRHFLETLENLLSCPCKPPLPQMRESPTQR